ncbi:MULTISPECIES: nucleotide exchange factor GrpE [Actinomycetes]|uniref:nucleotide exchange factor GrpE n=1 Tax=Actinomycetes TaxID=1760 RepID=UPI000CFB31ED|nr:MULTISPECIES: nucleotide exchange factor GrpE [unclassified Arthrobacter]MCS3494337.1 molecular chaperone GrpE [Arthrobacter sp. JUb119]PQZ88791.1 nucleotide exchange factor GrpE [Arthrobacter sp. MYb222]PRB74171.1 nucleotide exchange factor GrpE [Arthrobacter sp. MYb214]TDU27604.1 molecular chaperone GrpE [Arthrobacter sp. JUb115]
MSEAKDQNENSGQEPENQPEAANEQPTADALGQAEAILNEAAAGAEADSAQPEEAGAVETELRNDLLRLQAEYVNYRKRVERDRAVARENAVQSVLNTLLPVLDDIDAARAHGDLADGPFASIANKLDGILAQHGLERINEAGVEFDPNIHEALLRQAVDEIPADHVGQVLRTGYRKGTIILRAAQVLVATGE